MRIDKYLSNLGYGTKEEVHKYIKEGKIMVNQTVVEDFHMQINLDDIITIDKSIKKYKDYIYIMFNKPSDYVSSKADKNNETIFSLLPNKYQNLNIVGRLDKDVTGLILLTNNNKLYKHLINPENKINKKYLVTFTGDPKYIDQDYKKGIILDNGYETMPFDLEFISDNQAYITLKEGKYHEVKNIFSSLHMKVIELKRISISSIILDSSLEEGKYRELKEEEIKSLTDLI